MRFAYADPPYPGCANFYAEKTEVDHFDLVKRLHKDFPDGWALSTNSTSLRTLLPYCNSNVRVLSWVKPFCIFKPGVGLAYSWEPIIMRGGRKITRQQKTVRDWVSANITLKKGLTGAKPPDFCNWLLDAFNVEKGDTLVDLYPGTGIMGRCAKERGLRVK
jgi:hypothetical protein